MEVTRLDIIGGWRRVVNAARRTVGKEELGKEPSDMFKRKILLSEHSPIRLIEFDWTWRDIKQWVTAHMVRHHEGCEKFVHTQRPDRNSSIPTNRDELSQGALNEMDMTANAQAMINISRKRLCSCAAKETREAWKLVLSEVEKVDPILVEKCVPECVYRGFCPEFDNCCGYCDTEAYKERLIKYRSI